MAFRRLRGFTPIINKWSFLERRRPLFTYNVQQQTTVMIFPAGACNFYVCFMVSCGTTKKVPGTGTLLVATCSVVRSTCSVVQVLPVYTGYRCTTQYLSMCTPIDVPIDGMMVDKAQANCPHLLLNLQYSKFLSFSCSCLLCPAPVLLDRWTWCWCSCR